MFKRLVSMMKRWDLPTGFSGCSHFFKQKQREEKITPHRSPPTPATNLIMFLLTKWPSYSRRNYVTKGHYAVT